MFKHLQKYKQGQYTLNIHESHSKKCNAPKDSRGVYLVYQNDELIYISSSGRVTNDHLEPKTRVADGGGLWGRLTGGKLPNGDRIQRRLESDKINSVLIKWFVTYDETFQDKPADVRDILKKEYKELKGEFPVWNRKSKQKN